MNTTSPLAQRLRQCALSPSRPAACDSKVLGQRDMDPAIPTSLQRNRHPVAFELLQGHEGNLEIRLWDGTKFQCGAQLPEAELIFLDPHLKSPFGDTETAQVILGPSAQRHNFDPNQSRTPSSGYLGSTTPKLNARFITTLESNQSMFGNVRNQGWFRRTS